MFLDESQEVRNDMGKRAKNNRMQTDGSKTAVDSNHLEASSSTKLKRKSKGAKKKRQQWFNKCLNNKEKKGSNSKQSSNISVPLLPLPSVSSLQTPIPLTAGDAQRPGPSSTVTAGTDPYANSTHTPSTPSGPHRPPLLSMPLDRPAQRDMPWEHPGPAFKHNYFQDNSYNDYGSSGHYIDFSQDWPDPRGGPGPRWDRAPYRWQRGQAQESHNQGGCNRMGSGRGEPREFPGRQGPGERNQAWGSGARGRETEGRPPGPDGNHRGRPRPPRWDPRSRQPAPSKGRSDGSGGDTNGSPWNQLAKSFGSEHFHREEAGSGDLSSSGGSLRAAQADSSGLEDSGGSLGGKKRPRSLDREGKLSKSSRAEKSSTSGSGSLVASSRALSLTDLSGGEFQKPDSTSRPRTAHKALAPGKATGGPVGKKKQVGLKIKGVAGPTAAKTANGKTDKPDAEASDEGVLERAERMCKELREKRQEARVRSTSSDQRVAALRSALNTSARHFNSVHKSFFKGYASDSGSVLSTASSTAQKKHFSSSTSSTESQTRPKSASITAAANLQESQASVAASATSSLSQVSNKERIRHSIENSVRAERQVGKPTNRGPSSSAPHSLAASTSSLPSAATSRKKPPLPLSKDALAKMVSAPRSRTQRSQLARMLRQHTVTVSAQPKRVHLDGLYDNADDDEGDSIEDVLKNISGLEELGDCAELKNIKLEDLTSEDKHIIAQLIEDVDSTDRESLYGGRELADVVVLPQAPEVHSSSSFGRSEPSVIDVEMLVDRSRSPHRLQAPSPTPCQPLSLDDLNTERMQQETVIRSTLARSESPELSHARSAVVQALSPTRSSSEMRTVPDRMVTESGRPASRTGSGRDVDRYSPSPVAVAMETAEAPEPSRVVLGGDSLPSRSVGVLHEVMSLSHQQDAVVAEMRDIDVELSQMYKSLIEIVARMSGLQRRRVQLQSEGEQISQRRNHLLSGLLPDAAVSLSSSTAAAIERRRSFSSAASSSFPQNAPPSAAMDHTDQTASNTPQGASSRPPMGSSVTLPSWLSVPSPSARPAAERHREGRGGSETSVPATEQTSDYCLSGSVTSSVGSLTPRAASRSSVNSVQEVVTAEDQASSSALKYKPTAPRTMLSINGVTERNRPDGESSEKEIMVSSVSNVSVEGSHSVKSSVAADSSSGIGSSVGTAVVKPGQSTSDHQNSSSALSSAASSLNRQQAGQPHTSQSSDSSRLLLNSFTSPQPTNPNRGGDQVKSPGVSVAYLGSLSSDLVQQIVRNLPKTSQLGEANVPSMFVVRPGNSPQPSAAPAEAKSRSRTTSLHSISSDLSSGEHNFMSCVPPLQLGGSDKGGGSKTCTPRSESDAHSVTSGTSLGEQIKLFSELNTAGQRSASSLGDLSHLDVITLEDEDPPVESFAVGDMPDCSVLLQRLDGEKWGENSPGRRQEEDDADRPKKRKTKKDRNQSRHHRRHHVVHSSSEGEGEEDGDNSLPDIVISPKQQTSDRSSKSVQRVGSDFESEDGEMDSTLVGGELQLSQEAMSEDESGSQTSSPRPLSPSRLKLNPENLRAFRANVRQNLTAPASTDLAQTKGKKDKQVKSMVKRKDNMKLSGPCAPVMGIVIHGNTLYVGFQDHGVHSYTMQGEMLAEYCLDSVHCFTVTPAGSYSKQHVVIGGQFHLTFLTTADPPVVSGLNASQKVMCLLVVESALYAGLDTGGVMVVNLKTLQETRCFQASDCAIHCMTWTREGSTRLLCIASQDASIHVVDANSGLPIRIISRHSKTAFSLCMLDHFVLSGSGDRKVMAHNVHTAAFTWELNDHKGIVTSVCVDNGLLFSAGYDKLIRCYDLKSRRLLHLLYGAGKSIIMKMAIHNFILYTGNRDGQVEAVDLRDLGSFACECVACNLVFGVKEHLWHHLEADHLLPNTTAMRCPWSHCSTMLDTGSALVKAGEHMRSHIRWK